MTIKPEQVSDDEIVGHKTHYDRHGNVYHTGLTRVEAEAIMTSAEEERKRREKLMPDESSARKMLFDAYLRLKDFGWNDAIYCPKDGSLFDAIEAGSNGVHQCYYSGEWPTGSWWINSDYDTWPSRPVLFRLTSGASK